MSDFNTNCTVCDTSISYEKKVGDTYIKCSSCGTKLVFRFFPQIESKVRILTMEQA